MGNFAFLILLVLFVAHRKTFGQFPPASFKAAVVEYYPIQNRSASIEEFTKGNVDEYVQILSTVSHLNLDIIVFPESTITSGAPVARREDYQRLSTVIPTASEDVIPCTSTNGNFSAYFVELSCAARASNTYLVANLMEKSPCTTETCSNDNWNLYNANVVFDRRGKVIARYRKFNLFGEYPMNKTDVADVTVFTTDFGVTFGTFTCFDLLFETPALELIRQGVGYIIFPTMWFSELPFLTALQAQNMWAVENHAYFFAAGANKPSVGSGGSGIFLGKYGPLVMDIIGGGGSKVYVRDLIVGRTTGVSDEETTDDDTRSIDDRAPEMDDFYLKKDNLTAYKSLPLNLTNGANVALLCHEDFCCNFNAKVKLSQIAEGDLYYHYHVVAFSGVRHFDVMDGGVDICGLIACTNSSLDSCGTRFPKYSDITWPIRFENITVSATFPRTDKTSQFPNTLLSDIRPLTTNAYAWSSVVLGDGSTIERTITLVRSQNRLMTFGIYGRDVRRDNPSLKSTSSKPNAITMVLECVVVILATYLTQR